MSTQADFVALGFDPDIAEALAEREVKVGAVQFLSSYEIFEHFLEWNGIIGWTSNIVEAQLNIKRVKKDPNWLRNTEDDFA
jgi:hypothetical protein